MTPAEIIARDEMQTPRTDILPQWNDLPGKLRCALVDEADFYCEPGLGGDAALAIYNVLREGFPEQTFPLFRALEAKG